MFVELRKQENAQRLTLTKVRTKSVAFLRNFKLKMQFVIMSILKGQWKQEWNKVSCHMVLSKVLHNDVG